MCANRAENSTLREPGLEGGQSKPEGPVDGNKVDVMDMENVPGKAAAGDTRRECIHRAGV